ncbi:unnamed protein product, partial [Discosporangium mesarthrocarpum]
RSLARASGLKLGALQYHFPTWEALLSGIAAQICSNYHQNFESIRANSDDIGLRELVLFILYDEPGAELQGDRLWPQLWAMARVEPVMDALMNELYDDYLEKLESRLIALGRTQARTDALLLMSLLEGNTIFVGSDTRWAKEADDVRTAILNLIDNYYTSS